MAHARWHKHNFRLSSTLNRTAVSRYPILSPMQRILRRRQYRVVSAIQGPNYGLGNGTCQPVRTEDSPDRGSRDRKRTRMVRFLYFRLPDGRHIAAVFSGRQPICLTAADHRDFWHRLLHAPNRGHPSRDLRRSQRSKGRVAVDPRPNDGGNRHDCIRADLRCNRRRSTTDHRARSTVAGLRHGGRVGERRRFSRRKRPGSSSRLIRVLYGGWRRFGPAHGGSDELAGDAQPCARCI